MKLSDVAQEVTAKVTERPAKAKSKAGVLSDFKWKVWAKHLALGLGGFLLFYVALAIMKEGAATLSSLFQEVLAVTNVFDSMGLGWWMAWAMQSGSPVAAVAIAMLSAGTITPSQTYTMIAGSRLGASLIVLQMGFFYALREGKFRSSLTAGVLSLLLTASTLLIALPVGLLTLRQGWFDGVRPDALRRFGGSAGDLLEPLLSPVVKLLPGWALFVFGAVLIFFSFKLFDKALPQFNLEDTDLGQINRLVYRPTLMFLMGLVVTFVTMSVSISVGLLVPLSVRGYMRRENIMAYILGANVSTFFDTLIAAVLLGDPQGVVVVLVLMVVTAVISLLVVLFAYRQYERLISSALDWVTERKKNFALFIAIALIIPLVLVLL